MKDLLTLPEQYFQSLLFAAGVSYRKSYYESFRSPWWKRKIEKINITKDTMHNDNLLYDLFRLIQFDIIDRDETYTLAKLRNFHQQLTKAETNPAKLKAFA